MISQPTRQETISEILRLMPPRLTDREAAARNLDAVADDELREIRSRLIAAASRYGMKPTREMMDPTLVERRIAARQKIATGLQKLSSVSKKLENYDSRVSTDQKKSVRSSKRDSEDTENEVGWKKSSFGTSRPHILNTFLKPQSSESLIVEEREIYTPETEEARDFICHQLATQLVESNVVDAKKENIANFISLLLRQHVFEKYIEVQVQKISRDIIKLLLQEEFKSRMPWLEELSRSLTMPSHAVETTFIAESPELVGAADVVDGFAKMAARFEEYSPNRTIVVSGGGEIVGGVIKDIVSSYSEYITLNPRRRKMLSNVLKAEEPERILIIDDISRTGATLARLIGDCQKIVPDATVLGMALVGTTDSDQMLRHTTFFPNMSPSQNVGLPWDTKGEFRKLGEDYVLGVGNSEPFTLNKSLLAHAISGMK